MEEQCSPLSWGFHYQEEGIEELRQYSLLYSTLELEAAILSAHEEISRKDDEIFNLKGLLSKIVKERDEYQENCQTLVLENHLLFQQIQMQALSSSGNSTSNEDENIALSPSDCDENMVIASHGKEYSVPPPLPPLPPPLSPPLPPPQLDIIDRISCKKPLPEKGKFLKSVMEARPLLQTLLVAGPLPQWQHPPPKLNSIDIPLVTILSPGTRISHQDSCLISPSINGGFCSKRTMVNSEGSNFSPNSKYQKVVHQSSLTQHLVSP